MPTYVKTNYSNQKDMIQSLYKKRYKISNKVITTISQNLDIYNNSKNKMSTMCSNSISILPFDWCIEL